MAYSRDPIYDENRPGTNIRDFGYAGTENIFDPTKQRYERNDTARLPIGGSQNSLTPPGQQGLGIMNPLTGNDLFSDLIPEPAANAGPADASQNYPRYARQPNPPQQGFGTPGFQGKTDFDSVYGDTALFNRQPPSGPDSTDYNGLTVSDTVPQGALGITPPDKISTAPQKARELQQDQIGPSNLGLEPTEYTRMVEKRINRQLSELPK